MNIVKIMNSIGQNDGGRLAGSLEYGLRMWKGSVKQRQTLGWK